jgi:transcriptional regulator with GAF, ATPase, and Fis domain
LFLDEAGEMSLALQAKLLRVLNDGQIIRVGATTPRTVDVRIIVATHRDLSERVRDGQFREDLFYRLAVVPIEVPALRDRREDIPALVNYFLRITSRELKIAERGISPAAIAKLQNYDFRGNVRELRNLVERANILAPGDELRADDFHVGSVAVESSGPSHSLPEHTSLSSYLETIERGLLKDALLASGGIQAEAARLLGISRSDIAYKIKKYGL